MLNAEIRTSDTQTGYLPVIYLVEFIVMCRIWMDGKMFARLSGWMNYWSQKCNGFSSLCSSIGLSFINFDAAKWIDMLKKILKILKIQHKVAFFWQKNVFRSLLNVKCRFWFVRFSNFWFVFLSVWQRDKNWSWLIISNDIIMVSLVLSFQPCVKMNSLTTQIVFSINYHLWLKCN